MLWATSILTKMDKITHYSHYLYFHRHFLVGDILRAHTRRVFSKKLPAIDTRYNDEDIIDKHYIFKKTITVRVPRRAAFLK